MFRACRATEVPKDHDPTKGAHYLVCWTMRVRKGAHYKGQQGALKRRLTTARLTGSRYFSSPLEAAQVLGDLVAAMDQKRTLKGLRVALIGGGSAVTNSWCRAAHVLALTLLCICPPGHEPDITTVGRRAGLGSGTGSIPCAVALGSGPCQCDLQSAADTAGDTPRACSSTSDALEAGCQSAGPEHCCADNTVDSAAVRR